MRRYERSWWCVKEKKQMALVFIAIITMMLQLHMKGCAGCVESERIGLLQLKSYINSLLLPGKESFIYDDEEESILKSWTHGDCCHWKGVKCSDDIGGHIVHLSLNGFMRGSTDATLPRPLNLSLLHSFPQLQTFKFSRYLINHLFDPIYGYKSFQRLEKLRTLNFKGNELNNSILPFISAARSFTTLDLSDNSLDGVFPPKELANMTELRVMKMGGNRFSSFSVQGLNMTKLKTLDLSFNDLSFNKLAATTRLEDLVLPLSLQILDLEYNRLSSTPKGYSKICRLTNLQELSLQGNALTNMPYCLGNLSRLRTLDLSKNYLNGSLSFFVSALPSALEYLSLFKNNFNGSFWFNSLVNYTKLTVFELSSKKGTIQHLTESSWVPLFQLKTLRLQNFILDSTIYGFLLHQHDLCFVDLSHNKLTGAFPTWLLQNNTRLLGLKLDNNLLTNVQLPRLVHGLQYLDISSNMIYDSVQEDIGIVFQKLRYMNYSSNHFHGTIPSSMGEMKSLEILDVSSNGLYGQLPKPFLSNCYSLKFLKLSNNQFQGEIFPEQANFTRLEMLYLDGNRFSGNLGKGLLNSKWINLLDISENSISGVLPLWIGRISDLQYMYMSRNKLKGSFPHHQLQSLSQLQLMDISRNRFSGSIPMNVDFPYLRELRLQGNEFVGSIPDTFFKSEQLEVLDLRNNSFSGMILNAIGENSNLGVLLLRNNSFQTHIPQEICQLRQVGILDLSHNKFRGAIPSCLANMSFGERSDNITTFFGDISMFLDFTYCQYASHLKIRAIYGYQLRPAAKVEFLTKNRYETYQGQIISYMYGLDLSSNQLSGEIPVEIGNLKNIRSLDLSSNHLTGSIPDIISKLENLGSLDLSNNKLDGNIPSQLADLSGLGYFNVSYNNFSGEIPFKGHLITFDERSYIGNAHLCGPPTNNSCNPVSEPSASNQAKEEEEEENDNLLDMVWFYWTCGAVYISTILAMFVFLFIDSHWSRGWFYWVDLFIHYLPSLKGRFV